jgi:endonuclease YncB( thermonuclease family)
LRVLLYSLPFAVVVDRQMFRPIRQAAATAAWASDDWKRYHGQRFEAVEVVDGDTLDLAAVDGEKSTTRVRLIGVDTPETKHPTVGRMYFGPEATDFTGRLPKGNVLRCIWIR